MKPLRVKDCPEYKRVTIISKGRLIESVGKRDDRKSNIAFEMGFREGHTRVIKKDMARDIMLEP